MTTSNLTEPVYTLKSCSNVNEAYTIATGENPTDALHNHFKTSRVLYMADLRDADLIRMLRIDGMNVDSSDLSGVRFGPANVERVAFEFCDLRGADFRSASLWGATFFQCKLAGIRPQWSSHDLIAALLMAEARQSIAKRKLAGLLLVSRDWCWGQVDQYLTQYGDRDSTRWALTTLAQYCRSDDHSAPGAIRAAAANLFPAFPADRFDLQAEREKDPR